MPEEFIEITTAAEADALTEHIHDIVEGWYASERFDWDDFLHRLEKRGYELGSEMGTPAIRRIQKIARDHKRAIND